MELPPRTCCNREKEQAAMQNVKHSTEHGMILFVVRVCSGVTDSIDVGVHSRPCSVRCCRTL
jgi:hypothetical protein